MINQIKHSFKKFKREILYTGILILLIVISVQINSTSLDFKSNNNISKQSNEILSIKATSDVGLQAKFYKELIKRVGAEKAQEELFNSGLPFTGETHLLNHTAGDYLYEQYGVKGLPYCRDYFLSSCYHGFILHAIGVGGMSAVAETFAECLKFGHTVYGQCSHGMGHGFLANGGYKNLVQALKTCDEAERTMQGFPVFNCYDGVFMENIWAVHDGEPSKDRWVRENDPFYPCNAREIDNKYLLGCWSNQPSLVYQQFGGDIRRVATEVCDKVTIKEYKEMCFDGLSRQIHPLTKGETQKTFELCSVMPSPEWDNHCVIVNAGASYSVGDRKSPFEICAAINESGKNACYSRIFGVIRAYQKASENLRDLCEPVLEEKWRRVCEAK